MSNKIAYRNFCQTAVDLPIFAQDWYLDAVCMGGQWEVALVEIGGKIVASLPYFLKQKMGFTYSTIPLHVRHLGPYLIPEKRNLKSEFPIYQALIEQLPATAHFIQDFAPTVTNWLPFYWEGFKQTVRYTYTLELNDLDKVYRNFSRITKRKIKKAEKLVVIDHDISLGEYYQINRMTFERQNLPIFYSLESLQQLDAVLAAKNARKFYVARDAADAIHAVLYVVWDKTRSYALLGGSHSAYQSSEAMTLLIWQIIQDTKHELQLPIFDFAGSMLPQIEPIRRQFGAVQKPYFRVWKYESKVFELLSGVKHIFGK